MIATSHSVRKTLPGYNVTVGQLMDLLGTAQVPDHAKIKIDYKPGTYQAGYMEIVAEWTDEDG